MEANNSETVSVEVTQREAHILRSFVLEAKNDVSEPDAVGTYATIEQKIANALDD